MKFDALLSTIHQNTVAVAAYIACSHGLYAMGYGYVCVDRTLFRHTLFWLFTTLQCWNRESVPHTLLVFIEREEEDKWDRAGNCRLATRLSASK
jgi:hypothetical protein